MNSWWITWAEVSQRVANKKIILYGVSEEWISKTLRKLPQKPSYIVDRNEKFAGTDYEGMPIELPVILDGEDKDDIYIIITSGTFEGITSYLEGAGFVPGKHFCCCPEFQDYRYLEDMRCYEQAVYVSSSDYQDQSKARYSPEGGGIFRYVTGLNEIERLATGSFRQMEKVGDNIFAVEYVEGKVCVFDRSFKVLDSFPLERPNYCGIAYAESKNAVLLVNADEDSITMFDADNFKEIEKVYFSDKHKLGGRSHHHLNDICVAGDYAYVSYFSLSGNWKSGIYDGGVSEFSLDRLSAPGVQLYSDLWCPHSPKMIDGNLCVLDSLRGELRTNSRSSAGGFDGYLRGLISDDRYFYIGQSEDMYFSRGADFRKSAILNAGFYMFDPLLKAGRFFPMMNNKNVHDLLVF